MDNRSASSGVMVRVGVIVFGLLTLALLALSIVSERGLLAVRERERRYEDLSEKIELLEATHEAMREEIDNLKDPFGGEVERRAREELDLALPGEVVVAD